MANIVKGDGKSFGECKYGVKVLNKIQLKEKEFVERVRDVNTM